MPRLFLVAFLAVVSSSGLVAQVPPHLRQVPPDAAVFAHASVAKLWKGPVGEQLRAAKVAEFDRVVADFEAMTGLSPADVTSVSVYFPEVLNPFPVFPPFVLTLELTKPVDAGRLVAVAAAGCLASEGRAGYQFEKGVLTVRRTAYTFPKGGLVGKDEAITLDVSDPRRPRLFAFLPAKPDAAQAAGPLTPLLVAASTKDFVAGVNADRMPPGLRTNALAVSPELRPLLPMLQADLTTVVGDVTADKFTVEARFRSGDAAVTRECEKSLLALRTLLSRQLSAGRPKDTKGGPVAAVLDGLKAGVEAATTRVDGTDAVTTLAVPADLPFGPALAASMTTAKSDALARSKTQHKLKELGLVLHALHDVYGGFPTPATFDKAGKPLLSWRVAVLPYVDQGALYLKFKPDEAWDSEHNMKVLKDNPMPAVFALPGVTSPGDKETHFRVFVGNGAAFEPLKPLKFNAFTDGTSNTILVVTAAKAVPWTKPDELDFDPKGDVKKLLRMDGDGCNVLFADGSTRFVPSTIDGAKLKAAITRSGGEVLNLD